MGKEEFLNTIAYNYTRNSKILNTVTSFDEFVKLYPDSVKSLMFLGLSAWELVGNTIENTPQLDS